MSFLSSTEKARFIAKIDKLGPTQPHMRTRCWVWRGGKNKKGYGQFKLRGKQTGAHVVAYTQEQGPPVNQVLHRCDNVACVRPTHLFDGTHQENMDDKVSKNRQARGLQITLRRKPERMRGEQNPNSKLTDAEILAIRASYIRGGRGATRSGPTQKQLAVKYHVQQSYVGRIVRKMNRACV